MKVPYVISLVATILFIAFGVISFVLDLWIRELRIDVTVQEQELRAVEVRVTDQLQARQKMDQQIEALEEANDALRHKVVQQQLAIQTQQEQINQGAQISQQIGPNLLRDMATASQKNEKLHTLLTKHGYVVQTK